MKYFLDANICVYLMNAKFPEMNKKYMTRNPSDIFISSVVLSELMYGVRNSTRQEQNLAKLKVLLQDIQTVPFDDQAAHIAGQIRADLGRAGTPIGGNDVLIAATALAGNGTLVTNNTREFSRVKGLALEDWTLTS